jgi:hypothetical protein
MGVGYGSLVLRLLIIVVLVESVLAAAFVALVIFGCGSPSLSPPGLATSDSLDPVDVPPVNWDNPIDGVPMPSLAAASNMLPFEVYAPATLGIPSGLFVSPPEFVPRQRAVALIYDDP